MKNKLSFIFVILLSSFLFATEWDRTVPLQLGNCSYKTFDEKAKNMVNAEHIAEGIAGNRSYYIDYYEHPNNLMQGFIKSVEKTLRSHSSEVKNGDSFAFITNHYKGSKMFLLLYTQKRKDTEGKIYYKHYIYQFEVF